MQKLLNLLAGTFVVILLAYSLPPNRANFEQLGAVVDSNLINRDITQSNLKTTVCDGNGGWSTDLVRPSSSVTSKIKFRMMKELGTKLPAKEFQLDHIIPLTIGGAPLQPNLQLQPIAEARQKDQYEKYLWRQLCNGEVTLKEAQKRILDWEKWYNQAGLNEKLGGYVADEDDI